MSALQELLGLSLDIAPSTDQENQQHLPPSVSEDTLPPVERQDTLDSGLKNKEGKPNATLLDLEDMKFTGEAPIQPTNLHLPQLLNYPNAHQALMAQGKINQTELMGILLQWKVEQLTNNSKMLDILSDLKHVQY